MVKNRGVCVFLIVALSGLAFPSGATGNGTPATAQGAPRLSVGGEASVVIVVDTTGMLYGWGYNGAPNNWIQEEVDLSQYAGKKVQVRFEYVTDAAVTGEGFLLDDVSVEAANYQSDFETDDGGWTAEGFSRVQNIIPQTFRLSLITKGANGTTVEAIELSSDQSAEIPLSLENGEEAVLVVTGTTRYTRKSTAYQIEIK